MVSLSGQSNLADWSCFNVIILPFSFFCHLSRKSPDNVKKSESKFSRLGTLIKNKIKYSSYIRKFRMEQL
jgi:hypothetical protein